MFNDRYLGNNFSVLIAPIELMGNFSRVSGLSTEIECETYREGGNFGTPICLPVGITHQNIVLERGTVTIEPLTIWFETVMLGMHMRYPMIITMYDNQHIPVKIWTVLDVMPVKIDYPELDAMSDSVASTRIELSHGAIIPIL